MLSVTPVHMPLSPVIHTGFLQCRLDASTSTLYISDQRLLLQCSLQLNNKSENTSNKKKLIVSDLVPLIYFHLSHSRSVALDPLNHFDCVAVLFYLVFRQKRINHNIKKKIEKQKYQQKKGPTPDVLQCFGGQFNFCCECVWVTKANKWSKQFIIHVEWSAAPSGSKRYILLFVFFLLYNQ